MFRYCMKIGNLFLNILIVPDIIAQLYFSTDTSKSSMIKILWRHHPNNKIGWQNKCLIHIKQPYTPTCTDAQ